MSHYVGDDCVPAHTIGDPPIHPPTETCDGYCYTPETHYKPPAPAWTVSAEGLELWDRPTLVRYIREMEAFRDRELAAARREGAAEAYREAAEMVRQLWNRTPINTSDLYRIAAAIEAKEAQG